MGGYTRAMRLWVPWRFAILLSLGVVLRPSTALAPPLCSYQEKIGAEVLTLRVRLATVDGVQVTLPPSGYKLQSGCALDSLDGVLADPDTTDHKRTAIWGLHAP